MSMTGANMETMKGGDSVLWVRLVFWGGIRVRANLWIFATCMLADGPTENHKCAYLLFNLGVGKIRQLARARQRAPTHTHARLCLQEPYINRAALNIQEEFSLHRTYMVFRSLGLRHMTVVDMANRIVGILSRKDLMGFNLEERLEQRKRRGYSLSGGIQKLLPSERDDMWDSNGLLMATSSS